MGPVRQNPIQRTVSLLICVCIALCTIVAHNIAQNRPDSFPPYPPDKTACDRETNTSQKQMRSRHGVKCAKKGANCAYCCLVHFTDETNRTQWPNFEATLCMPNSEATLCKCWPL